MKFTSEFLCGCGQTVSVSTYGDFDWPSAVCPKCHTFCVPVEALSVSPTGERLLHRSRAELEGGDYSLAIVIATFAVEAFLAGLFLKARKIAFLKAKSSTVEFPLPTQEEAAKAWNSEFRNKKGFKKAADFVSREVAGRSFDDFVVKNSFATEMLAKFPGARNCSSTKEYFHSNLFECRNKIAHWGYVASTEEEAQRCFSLAVALVSILREMDRAVYHAL